jgi:inosose dehydratase
VPGGPLGFETITWGLEPSRLHEACKDIAEMGFRYFEVLNVSNLVVDFERRTLKLGPLPPPQRLTDTDYLSWLSDLTVAMHKFNLRVTSIFTEAEFINPNLWELELEQFKAMAVITRGLGARHLVCGGGPEDDGTNHSPSDYAAMARALGEVGRCCNDFGLRLCYHPHIETFVQTTAELDRLAEATDPELVGFCIDPAHFVLTGGDPVDIFRRHIKRIEYCHLKDVQPGDVGSLRGLARYEAFAELGQGQVDLVAIVEILRNHAFDGPIIVELDYSKRTPRESAEISKAYLADKLGLVAAAAIQ